MPDIICRAYPLHERTGSSYSISLTLGQDTPNKRYSIKTVGDAQSALASFTEEVRATGKPYMCSVTFDKKSGRCPAGFRAAEDKMKTFVNEHLATGYK